MAKARRNTLGHPGQSRKAAPASFAPAALERVLNAAASGSDLISTIRAGIPVQALDQLQTALDLTPGKLAGFLRIPPRTLARRQQEGRLNPSESERLVRVNRLYRLALETFEGDVAAVQRWFRSPQRALGNQTPLDFVDTEPGAREVENLLGRLQHGVFS